MTACTFRRQPGDDLEQFLGRRRKEAQLGVYVVADLYRAYRVALGQLQPLQRVGQRGSTQLLEQRQAEAFRAGIPKDAKQSALPRLLQALLGPRETQAELVKR